MPFVKGQKKKGGRTRGVSNRIKTELKSKVQILVDNNFEKIQDDLESLEAKDRLTIIIKLIEYVLPKERETKIDFSSLTDEEIDELIERVTHEASR